MRDNCRNRGVEIDLDALVRLDAERRERITEQQSVQERRNKLAQAMKGRKPSDEERQLGKELKERDAELEEALVRTRDELARLHPGRKGDPQREQSRDPSRQRAEREGFEPPDA